jgi:hypothetical protein
MRYVLLVLSAFGFVSCGVATCAGVLNYEPPHPHHSARLSEDGTQTAQVVMQYEVPDSATHAVSIYPSEPACSLTVLRANGDLLKSDKSQGGLCVVTLSGTRGDVWRIQATGAPGAEVQVAFDNPVYPKPLGHIALAGLALGLVSLVAMVVVWLIPRSKGHLR